MADGGYDAGYAATACFWGTAPSSLVEKFLASDRAIDLQVLDIGCGEGKNANAFAQAGCRVLAIDCSELAIQNGQHLFRSPLIEWRIDDATTVEWPAGCYDVIVSYGLLHCLPDRESAAQLIARVQGATKPNGFNILCTFNDRSHDLSAHPGFEPLLLSHRWYLDQYTGWTIREVSDTDLHETHPHNLIPHHHSLTRLIAKKHG